MALQLFQPGATFTVTDAELVPGGDPETSYTVRYFTADDADRLRKAATGPDKFDHKKSRMEPGEFDGLVYALSILDHVIADWTGIENNGQPLPCTLEYKRVLPASRREKLLLMAQENVQVKAAQQAESFRPVALVR